MSHARILEGLVEKLINVEATDDNFYREEIVVNDKTIQVDLGECSCTNTEIPGADIFSFDRRISKRRSQIETIFLERVAEHFPQKQKILNYVSMGAGQLLQDFVLCSQLLQNGYSLSITLIEPHRSRIKTALPGFKSLFDTTEVRHFASIRDYLFEFPEEEIHIAQAIDFTDPEEISLDDLCLTYQKLATNGFLYVASGFSDIIFNKLVQTYINFYLVQGDEDQLLFNYIISNLAKFDGRMAQVEELIMQSTNIQENRLVKNILSYTGRLFTLSLEVEEEKIPEENEIRQRVVSMFAGGSG